MALRWVSALVAAAALGVFATANIAAALTSETNVAFAVNLVLAAVGAGAAVTAVIAECYCRLDARMNVLADVLVTRLDEIVSRIDDLDETAGVTESYPPRRGGVVVSLASRARARPAPADGSRPS